MLRVTGGVVEKAIVVGYAVPREIQQQQVVAVVAIAEERLDVLFHLVPRLVQDGLNLEAADRRVIQYLRQDLGVLRWSDELAQNRVLILRIRDD